MIGSSFFRSNKDKCPKCGTFGTMDGEDSDLDRVHQCPACSTRFNEYVILEEGPDVEFQNH